MSIHKVAEDLRIALADSISRNDPNKYYKVQILEEDKGRKAGTGHKAKESNKASKCSGSLMDVRCSDMRYASESPFMNVYLMLMSCAR